MPLRNLALVTETLTALLTNWINALPAVDKSKVTGFTVLPIPPDRLTGERAIGLYLYHVLEDPYYKNLPPPAPDTPPVQFVPMGLQLFYQLCPHSDLAEASGPLMEHTLLGYAMKCLHDNPCVDKDTKIGGVPVFPTDLEGTDNRFIIDLLPIPPEQAVNYWTAGQHAARVAAYYKVSVVLLKPEKPRERTGRVLLYGVYTFLRGSPRLEGSRSVVTYRIPGEATDREAEPAVAEAPVGGRIFFYGSDLIGDVVQLVINGPGFQQPVTVGSDWGVTGTESEVQAVVQPRANLNVIVPGTYTAQVQIIDKRVMPDKTVRDFIKTSNATPFTVTPDIVKPIPPANAQGVVTITGGLFKDPAIPADAVQLFVGSNNVPPKPALPLNAGQFEVVDATHLRFRFPIGSLVSGDTVPLRIIVNGAESAPNWAPVP